MKDKEVSHTKLKYDECFAKLILEEYFLIDMAICNCKINRICLIEKTI